MSRKNIKREIISSLLSCDRSVSELASICEISRVSISKALFELQECEIVSKTPSSTKYSLSKIMSVILKLSNESAELILYSHGKPLKREIWSFIHSLSHDENVTLLAQNAIEYRRAASEGAQKSVSCILYSDPRTLNAPTPRDFDIKEARQALIGKAIERIYLSESVLYVNSTSPLCVLCHGGKTIASSVPTPRELEQAFMPTLTLLKPDRIVFEAPAEQALINACQHHKIPFVLLENTLGLSLDEREILIEGILKLTK